MNGLALIVIGVALLINIKLAGVVAMLVGLFLMLTARGPRIS